MMCVLCRRDARGFAYLPEQGPLLKLCSMQCLEIITQWNGMIPPNFHEQNALADASAQGGAYVESIGKTDLTTWSEAEWATLIEVIVTAFQDSLRTAYADFPPSPYHPLETRSPE
jgi:hypothetical protein